MSDRSWCTIAWPIRLVMRILRRMHTQVYSTITSDIKVMVTIALIFPAGM